MRDSLEWLWRCLLGAGLAALMGTVAWAITVESRLAENNVKYAWIQRAMDGVERQLDGIRAEIQALRKEIRDGGQVVKP